MFELANGMSKGCGVAEYATREEALCAIEKLNESEINGRRIFVREDREPHSFLHGHNSRHAAGGEQGVRQLLIDNVRAGSHSGRPARMATLTAPALCILGRSSTRASAGSSSKICFVPRAMLYAQMSSATSTACRKGRESCYSATPVTQRRPFVRPRDSGRGLRTGQRTVL